MSPEIFNTLKNRIHGSLNTEKVLPETVKDNAAKLLLLLAMLSNTFDAVQQSAKSGDVGNEQDFANSMADFNEQVKEVEGLVEEFENEVTNC